MPNQPISAEVSERIVIALKCGHAHVTMWPEKLTPYPDTCPCWAGPGRARCGSPLHETGARFRRLEGNGA